MQTLSDSLTQPALKTHTIFFILGKKTGVGSSCSPTEHFTISGPQIPWTDGIYLIKKTLINGFCGTKIVKSLVGWVHLRGKRQQTMFSEGIHLKSGRCSEYVFLTGWNTSGGCIGFNFDHQTKWRRLGLSEAVDQIWGFFFFLVCPDRIFPNFRRSRSGDRPILCSWDLSWEGFWSYKTVKGSVGVCVRVSQ